MSFLRKSWIIQNKTTGRIEIEVDGITQTIGARGDTTTVGQDPSSQLAGLIAEGKLSVIQYGR